MQVEHESAPCVLCGERESFSESYGVEFCICSQCADRIASLYWLKHTGQPLTWGRERPAMKPFLNAATRWQILRRDGFTCQSCGAADRPMHVDHIHPRAKGGSDAPENLQALCSRCNMQKGAK